MPDYQVEGAGLGPVGWVLGVVAVVGVVVMSLVCLREGSFPSIEINRPSTGRPTQPNRPAYAPGPSGDGADAAPEPQQRGRDGRHDERPPPAGHGQRGPDEEGVDGRGDEAGDAVAGLGDGEHRPGVGRVDDACVVVVVVEG